MGEKWIICRWKALFSVSMADWSFYFAGLCPCFSLLKLFYAWVLRGIALFLDLEFRRKGELHQNWHGLFMFFLIFPLPSLVFENNSVFVLYEVTFSTVIAIVFGAARFSNIVDVCFLCVFQAWSSLPVRWRFSGSQRGLITPEMPMETSLPWCTLTCR